MGGEAGEHGGARGAVETVGKIVAARGAAREGFGEVGEAVGEGFGATGEAHAKLQGDVGGVGGGGGVGPGQDFMKFIVKFVRPKNSVKFQ